MKNLHLLFFSAIAACGGGGGSDDTISTTQTSTTSSTLESYQTFNGIVADGYIRGSDVFIDTNANYIRDNGENFSTTDNEGRFSNLKFSIGNLISLGGVDVDTANLLDRFFLLNKLSSHSDSIVVTPITTVAALADNPSTIIGALGIDDSININTTDPIANLSRGGIYSYLYEKGNQLAVMALSLQNAINVYNSTTDNTKDYFAGIAQVLEQEYTSTPDTVVDIEGETFINKLVDNITATKASNIDSAITINIKSALKAAIPVIRPMSNASTTKVIQKFAFSTLQTDIKAIASGTASTASLASYASDILTYIATDQAIALEDLNWVNSLPIFTSAAIYTAAENQTAIGTVTATDVDGDPLTYSLTGSDASAISISSSGVMTFNTAPDYETKTSYSITANVSDDNYTISKAFIINITNLNDNSPVITSGNFSDKENQTSVGIATATDADNLVALTYTLSGTDVAYVTIDENTGVITLNSAPDYEDPEDTNSDGVYNLIINVSDSELSTSKEFIFTVEDVNLPAVKLGQTIVGVQSNVYNIEKPRWFKSISLDSDGSTVAVGVQTVDGGLMRVYKYINNSSWSPIDAAYQGFHLTSPSQEFYEIKVKDGSVGNIVELSGDGTRLVSYAGTSSTMYFPLFELTDDTWMFFFNDPDLFGSIKESNSGVYQNIRDVDMSSDGKIISFVTENDNEIDSSNNRLGKISIYDLSADRDRDKITGSSSFLIRDGDISSDGKFLVVGGWSSVTQGAVIKILEWNEATDYYDVIKGSPIVKPAFSGAFGTSGLSINATGNIIAVADFHANKSDSAAPYSEEYGAITIFEWDTNLNDWKQKGSPIWGDQVGDKLGSSETIGLSADGKRVAVSSTLNDSGGTNAGQVKVFEWSVRDQDWKQTGFDIYGDNPENYSGMAIDLSENGNVIAIAGNDDTIPYAKVFYLPLN